MNRASDGAIRWRVPEDGGTPRSPERIVPIGPQEFLIRACAEEGDDILVHAVSRVDLICRNEGDRPLLVTLHLDLSGDGKRADCDETMWGGMSTRNFLFIRPSGEDWRQVEGAVEGWVATISFAAPPGETEVGLSPWYTYHDYLQFVAGLPAHPHLRAALVGHSDGGREHWELTITDPGVPREQKRCVFWHVREHAYETFSSFALEGAISYLLSEEAAEVRRRFEVVFHPMTNVDGVAQGYEYRGGYDAPEGSPTATLRLTSAALERVRPDFVITWHNWIAPRDEDVLFYTDDINGEPTRRAWDLFTQRFPSPRRHGHRWHAEANPLTENWAGRPLDEESTNVHQYAAKHFGSRVWGWELPWWNRSVEEARRAGASFAYAFFAVLALIGAGGASAAAATAPVEVPRWEMHEFVLQGPAHVDNPYLDAALVGHFTAPSGRTVTAEGFYDGNDTWRLRFAPDEEGDWQYLLRGEGVELQARGKLHCTAPKGRGPIRVHPGNPHAFAYADGAPFFPMGDTCYGLYSDSQITPKLRAQYLQTRRSQHFNYVRMGVLHSLTHPANDPDFWPWGETMEQPDLDRFNPRFFQGLDAVLFQMGALGMNAELIVLDLYQQPFNDPTVWTQERERQWLRYLTARYSAFSNIFMWTISNEYELHPDGVYRLDVPGDPDWAKATARSIKRHDPYHHLVTVHPVASAALPDGSPPDNPNAPQADPPWRVGEFFGVDDAMDVISQQTGQAGTWDEQHHCVKGNAPCLVASIQADRRYRKPVINSESGYEYLRGYPTYNDQVHCTDKVRRTSWRIACAGGYFAAGFSGTLGMSDFWNSDSDAVPGSYTFVVKDEGAAGQLGLLYDFFAALPFWRMQPFAGVKGEMTVALADPGELYVVYLPVGGRVTVDLHGVTGSLTGRWFDPRQGKYGGAFPVTPGAEVALTAPDATDWALELRRCG